MSCTLAYRSPCFCMCGKTWSKVNVLVFPSPRLICTCLPDGCESTKWFRGSSVS